MAPTAEKFAMSPKLSENGATVLKTVTSATINSKIKVRGLNIDSDISTV